MPSSTRRDFVKKAALSTGIIAAPAVRPAWGQSRPSDTVNIGVVGFHGRGRSHYRTYAKMPNVRVNYLCDVDQRLFPGAVSELEELIGHRPKTVVDFRELIENKDLDAVSIATPDHWHALQTVWGCQAGKDVYVEKPVCYCLTEGRKMVQAARKYDRIVQCGLNRRSSARMQDLMQFLHSGEFGDIYRAKALIYKGRASIGKRQESSIPEGVNWDLYLGPAKYRAFNLNRFHYGWHFFWDTSTTDIGNTGVHHLDAARWGMNKSVHPVKIHCFGGTYVYDSYQETPTVQTGSFEYADGTIMEVELNNLYTPPVGGVMSGEIYYTSKGYVSPKDNWTATEGVFTPRPNRDSVVDERAANASFPKREYKPGPKIPDLGREVENNFENFITCVRSHNREDLYVEIEEGHMSTALCHLANISYKTGRKITFDPATESIPDDPEANQLLTRKYRKPYEMPAEV